MPLDYKNCKQVFLNDSKNLLYAGLDNYKDLPFIDKIHIDTIPAGKIIPKWKKKGEIRGYVLKVSRNLDSSSSDSSSSDSSSSDSSSSEEQVKPNHFILHLENDINTDKPVKDKCVIWIHGGSFTYYQTNPTYLSCSSYISYLTGCDVWVPDFRLLPDYHYPTQVKDVIKLIYHLIDSHQYSSISLMGDSSGGTIALNTITLIITNKKYSDILPYISNLVLFSPWIDLECKGESYYTREWCSNNLTGDIMFRGKEKMNRYESRQIALQYLGNKSKLLSKPQSNPFYITKDIIEQFPPTLIFVGDEESLRSDIVNFSQRLQPYNENLHISIYNNMWHVWVMYSLACDKNPNTFVKNSVNAYLYASNFILGKYKSSKWRFKSISPKSVFYLDTCNTRLV